VYYFFKYVAVFSVISGGAISVENSQNPEERRKGLHLVRPKLWQERYLTLVSDGLIPPTKKETHRVVGSKRKPTHVQGKVGSF
jgi:hypothetical protein